MSIIKDTKSDARSEIAVEKVKEMNTFMYNNLNIMHKSSFDYIWSNKDFTAKEIMDGFGSDAALLFLISSKIQELLKTVNNAYEPLMPNKPYTINPDGTVTIEE